jgi:hypothetical protein
MEQEHRSSHLYGMVEFRLKVTEFLHIAMFTV